MQVRVVERVDFRSVREFNSHLRVDTVVQSDLSRELRVISKDHEHQPKVRPPAEIASWPPKVLM